MRWTSAHIPTLREAPQEAEVISHALMLRAGMIRKLAAGIYSYLPLGWRSLRKVEMIIREEMDRSGALEVSLPMVQPKEIWEESGRWSLYGKELGRFKDRHDRDFCLQPTSEEAITDLVRRDLKSYKQLPLNFYQIQTKFRDEIRPRFGIMRGREFLMKDAYSYDIDEEKALQSYERMRQVYRRIFLRSGLKFKPVVADTGAIGGSQSEEFTVLADSGEDEIVSCESCHYAANQEKAESQFEFGDTKIPEGKPEKFATPGIKTIEALSEVFKMPSTDLMKTVIATDSESHIIAVMLRGDHQLHEIKLQRWAAEKKGWKGVRLASDEELNRWKLPKGSLGPVELSKADAILIDSALNPKHAYVSGANEEGFHFRNLILTRDLKNFDTSVLRVIEKGELCIRCGRALEVVRGIEVGHVFYLGKKYSEAMHCEFTDESGKAKPAVMGCYGIGVGRTLAACLEQNHDKDGILFPLALAPYEVILISLGETEPVVKAADQLYLDLKAKGVDILWDDRVASAGVKLKDADLIGIPYQIILGERGLKNSEVEWKIRRENKKENLAQATIVSKVCEALENERKDLQRKLEEVY